MRLRLISDYTNQKNQKSRVISTQKNDYLIISKIGCQKSFSFKENKKEEINHRKQKKIQLSNMQLFKKELANNDNLISSLQLIKPMKHSQYKYVSMHQLQSPNFPTLSYSILELISFSKTIMSTSNFTKKLKKNMLSKLIVKISEGYKNLSYHNFSHGFSLMLLNHQCINKSTTLRRFINDEEYLYIMIAGLAHDIGHSNQWIILEGTNNQFQIKCNSQLAKVADNKAVLQNMHIRLLWKLLEDYPECNFLNFSSNSTKAKQIITRLILNTDMAVHFSNLEILKKLKQNINFNNDQHKWFLLEQMFHACDIGNSTQQFDNYINWAYLVSHQFNQQAKLQEQLHIQVTKSFVYTDIKGLYKDQIWFLGQMVQPLWKQIECLLPKIAVYCKNIQNNLEKVKALSQI